MVGGRGETQSTQDVFQHIRVHFNPGNRLHERRVKPHSILCPKNLLEGAISSILRRDPELSPAPPLNTNGQNGNEDSPARTTVDDGHNS